MDMIGKRFKSLTVIALDEEKNNKIKEDKKNGLRKSVQTYYICRCDCGNILSLMKPKIQRRKEFGCVNCKHKDFTTYINEKINHWTILNFIKDERKFLCKCDCGTIKTVNPYNIINNQSKDCGCGRKISVGNLNAIDSLVGNVYGKLTVLEEVGKNDNHKTICKCLCECGNIVNVLSNSLRTEHTISCGCVKSQMPFEIKKYLNSLDYEVEMEKRIKLYNEDINCMYFDLYIEELNLVIEYDGKGHFEPIDWAGKGKEWALEHLKLAQHRDSVKNNYCKNNNINLLRIPYTQKDNFKQLVNEKIIEIKNK